jgi:protein tyrosine/serine phosphatase
MHRTWVGCLAVLFHIWVSSPGLADCSTETEPNRNPSWAAPVKRIEVPNLYRVAPNFYRSAQPDQHGFAELVRRCGLQNVINLRAESSDAELLKGLRVHYFYFPMHEFLITPNYVIAIGALQQLVRSVREGPTLVHCEAGANRTGFITALYRMAKQSWRNDAAIDELENGGYGFFFWLNIPFSIWWTDLDNLKQQSSEVASATRTK